MYGRSTGAQCKHALVATEELLETVLELIDMRTERYNPVGIEGIGHIAALGASHMIHRKKNTFFHISISRFQSFRWRGACNENAEQS